MPAYLAADLFAEFDLGGVGCYRLHQAQITADAVLLHNGQALWSLALNHPEHLVARIAAQDRTGWPVRRVAGQVAILHGPGYDVYGHWLVDFLPRLYVLSLAGFDILRLKFVLPADIPGFALEFLRLIGIPAAHLVRHESRSELIEADECVVPTILRLKSRLSPLFNAASQFWIERFRANAGLGAKPPTGQKIFVSRAAAQGNRTLKNRAQIEEMAVRAGYRIVHPQALPLPDQCAIFAGATEIAGEYGSGLHGSIFAPPGAVICALRGTSHAPGFVQSALAAACGHQIGYVFAPSDEHAIGQAIDIDPGLFGKALEATALWAPRDRPAAILTQARPRSLEAIAKDGDPQAPDSRVHHALSLASSPVDLPALPIGAAFLTTWPIREHPGAISWQAGQYESISPALFVIRDAVIHSSAGLVRIGGSIVSETLVHTDPRRHGYTATPSGIALNTQPIRALPGTHVSILAGASKNYFHALLDGVMRLSMLPEPVIAGAQGLLCPKGAVAQPQTLALMQLPAHLQRIEVDDGETLRVERLVLPLSVYGLANFHPCVSAFFNRIAGTIGPGETDFPRRFYIDRRGAAQRSLVNEDEIIARLGGLGFVPIRPETLGIADQIRLFREAEAIVAPHGAALTNLGYCRAGCIVLELHMDAYVHWAFRHLAALRRLRYDCVLGRAIGPWPERPDAVHGMTWRISPDHVFAAASHMLAAS